MNIKRAKEEIKNTLEAYLLKDEYGSYIIPSIRQRPVLLIGPPGVGKTQIMEQISQECQLGLVSYTITHHTRQSAIGLPFIEKKVYGGKEYAVTEYTMSEIVAAVYDKIEKTGLSEGILFIDEINCVSETLAPTMLQFLQCKTFGNHKIPEGWMIVAAGNPPEFNKSVREFDVVTLDRIKLVYVEADFEVWKEYAYQADIHPAILSYLGVKNSYFCQIETTVDGKLFATPRGWEDLSRLIEVYEILDNKRKTEGQKAGITADREVIFQYIQHRKIAKDFANYLELYYKYQDDYQVDEILSGEIKETLLNRLAKASFDERLSVIGLLLARLSSHFKQIYDMEQLLNQLVYQLKEIIKRAEEESEDITACLEQTIRQMEKERLHKKEAELLGRREEQRLLQLIHKLESYSQVLKSEHLNTIKEQKNCLKKLISDANEDYETVFELGKTMLEYGFDFMEAAFGNGQEMVIFITELNTSYYCVSFLREYGCERYYQYNKSLLFEDREAQIQKKINSFL